MRGRGTGGGLTLEVDVVLVSEGEEIVAFVPFYRLDLVSFRILEY